MRQSGERNLPYANILTQRCGLCQSMAKILDVAYVIVSVGLIAVLVALLVKTIKGRRK